MKTAVEIALVAGLAFVLLNAAFWLTWLALDRSYRKLEPKGRFE